MINIISFIRKCFSLRNIFGLLLMLNLLVSISKAQSNTGSIYGVVTDEQGFRISGVNITIEDQKKKLTYKTSSNNEGIFVITNLSESIYQVAFEKEGFDTFTSKTIVAPSISTLFDCVLKPKAIMEVIEVIPNKSTKIELKEAQKELKYISMRNNLARLVVSKTLPSYPDELFINRIQGDIYITAIVNPNGEVIEAFFLRGDSALSKSALSAVKKWKFQKSEYGFFGYIGLKYIIKELEFVAEPTVSTTVDVFTIAPYITFHGNISIIE